jgi:parallel beta-helix repeat protein/predicted outer membrane repeat protein
MVTNGRTPRACVRGPRAAGLATGLWLLPAVLAGAATWTVDVNGSGDFTAIQPALTAAGEGDVVLVLPGTYTGADNRNLSFGTKNLVLRGSGGAAATIIDCQNTGGTRGINFSGGGQDSTCVVEGFTIRRGRLVAAGAPGAGIRCENASPKLVGLVVEDNTNVASYGGGLHCNNFASPIVRDCVFEGNHAQAGGGIYCNTSAAPIVRGVSLVDNHAVTSGGGAYCGMDSDAMFVDVVFDGNSSGHKGGGFFCFRSSPAVAEAVFFENTAVDSGGAFYIQRASYPMITNCTMSGNSAPSGGAICVSEPCDPTVMQSVVAFTGPGASTIRCGGGNPTITRCVVFGNAPGDSLCGDHHDNAFLDPLFCNVLTGDLTLASNSPCLPGNAGNPSDALVGALGQGCVDSPVEAATWGRIKCLFR